MMKNTIKLLAAIMETFGPQRPFSNIIRVEGSHISALLPLFDVYSVSVPANDAAGLVVAPSPLDEIFQTGVVAEQKNIAMYQRFIAEDLPEDVWIVFTSLLRASENHQRAFEQAASGEPTALGTADRSLRGNRSQAINENGSVGNPDTAQAGVAEMAGNANRSNRTKPFGQMSMSGRTMRQNIQGWNNFRTNLFVNPEVA